MTTAWPGRTPSRRSVLAAPDTFKGTCSSVDVAAAIERGAREAGWDCDNCALSDGGDGFSGVIAASSRAAAGGWRTAKVTGPLGEEVAARWWWAPPEAFVESAAASGLVLAGGSRGNDPLGATSRGTGELIAAAIRAGAARVVVGVGGSASTDGGLGAIEAVESAGLLDSGALEVAEVIVACDVEVRFVEAAERFGPQKGASAAQVSELRDRLVELAERYRWRFGVDVTSMPRSGAAGGLAGGLAALGARLVRGFDLVAELVGLERRIAEAGLVVTGEGRLDSTTWTGKVVSGVFSRQRVSPATVPVLVVAGSLGPGGWPPPPPHERAEAQLVSIEERFGTDRARKHPAECIEQVVRELLQSY